MATNRHLSGDASHDSGEAGCRPARKIRSGFSGLLLLLFFVGSSVVQATGFCGEFTGRGYDYTNPQLRAKHLGVVERVHFTEDVRTLRKGATTYLIGDLEYVLNSFPNHHPALDALARLALREGTTRPNRSKADLECRFLWAARAQPNDAMVRVVQGIYYFRAGRHSDAKQALAKAAELAPENPEVHYNLGLALFQLKDYENARVHAEKAYDKGYPLPGLRNMLERAGHPLSD